MDNELTAIYGKPKKKHSFEKKKRALLLVLSGANLGKTHILDSEKILVGRDKSCDLCLNDDGVSKEHCFITVREGYYFLEDARSSNGTYIEGKKVKKKSLLNHFDRIVLGKTVVRFFMEEAL